MGTPVTSIPNSIVKIGKNSFKWCQGLNTITIPNGIIEIDDGAFESCQYLSEIKISDSVIKIGKGVFSDCRKLETVIIPYGKRSKFEQLLLEYKDKLVELDEEENLSTEVTDEDLANAWTDEFGVKYSADRKRLLEMPRKIDKYSVLVGTKVICDSSLPDRWGGTNWLYSINLPKGLLIIGRGAFKNSKIWQITIPDSVLEIRPYAFGWCYFLKGITIPRGLKKIGDCAFSLCRYLDKITIPEGVVEICSRAFYCCDSLTSIEIPDGVTSIGDSAFDGCTKLVSVKIPNSVRSIGKCAFRDCQSLETVRIPDYIKNIESGVFAGCASLKTIFLPSNVKTIKDYAFTGCKMLTSINIPERVHYIGIQSFFGCVSLSSISIPGSISHWGCENNGIGAGVATAFVNCKSLKSIIIPKGTIRKYEKPLLLYKDILVEQKDEEICLAYCSEDAQACEDKEYASWQPHSKIIKKNGKLGVVIDDGTTKKQIIPFNYDTWFDYDGYETDIRENFFDNYQDYLGYFAIKNFDGTYTIHGYDKDGTLTISFTCEKFDRDSYRLNGKYVLRYPKDGVEYDKIERKRMHYGMGTDDSYFVFRKGNKWSLKSDDLKITYIDEIVCDGFGDMYWTPSPKGDYIPIIKGKKRQICLFKEGTEPLILPDNFDDVSLRFFTTTEFETTGSCFVIKKGDYFAVCSSDLLNISPFVFSSVESMINDNEVKVKRNVNGKEFEFIYKIINGSGWRYKSARSFSSDEVATVNYADVFTTQYGLSARFKMKDMGIFGGYKFIPLSILSTLSLGDTIDMNNAMLLTLCKEGEDDIARIIEQ